ncbi:hypothetical protein, partial [Mesorhizobium sp. M5C.F.Ca.IN.020.29.1.1]|uniref:hypothetical protein n=1 Tax=Mesorhizobium sp. M5C.F.Ca.IN.020.29.1.1 TaxID=2496770 RepID=UPI0019CFFCEE
LWKRLKIEDNGKGDRRHQLFVKVSPEIGLIVRVEAKRSFRPLVMSLVKRPPSLLLQRLAPV